MTNKQQASLLFEQMNLSSKRAIEPFIYTDILAEYAGNNQTNAFHFWSMEKEVVLGMKDTRVTDLAKGVEAIEQHGYHVIVRNSGGLAVVADEGILNFSIILPQQADKFAFSIDDGYELMKQLIETSLWDFNCQIDAFEVTDSYCPGDFDLSINGKKFAGISQRRIKKGIAIMIYLSVNGNQTARGELVREFYQASLGSDFGKDGYPPVNPEAMANLSDLLKAELSVLDMKNRLVQAIEQTYELNDASMKEFNDFQTTPEFEASYTHQLDRMLQRNDILQEKGGVE